MEKSYLFNKATYSYDENYKAIYLLNDYQRQKIVKYQQIFKKLDKVETIFSSRPFLQKTNERILLYYYETLGRLVFVRFLEEIEDTKKTFQN